MDSLTPEERSRNMSKIRGKNTQPELMVRSMLSRAGYPYLPFGGLGEATLPFAFPASGAAGW